MATQLDILAGIDATPEHLLVAPYPCGRVTVDNRFGQGTGDNTLETCGGSASLERIAWRTDRVAHCLYVCDVCGWKSQTTRPVRPA